MLEGKKILPPPMLMPLENAPKPPPLNKLEKSKKKKKKKRDRGGTEKDDLDRETDVRSPPEPPENLTPPRGFAAPLHPPPSATRQRGQSGIPSPKYSKGAPQKHEPSRYQQYFLILHQNSILTILLKGVLAILDCVRVKLT